MTKPQTQSREKFLHRLETDIVIFDGGMGTSIYSKGVYFNDCFDNLNLSDPGLILDIHKEYIEAGSEAIETNTFGANRIMLGEFNLGDQAYKINYEGAKIAREAGGESIFVAGSVGPLGIKIEPWGETSVDEAKDIFKEQIEGLYEGGVDCFILETFSDLNEIHQAIRACKEVCDLPIIAQMSIDQDGASLYGTPPAVYTKRLDEWGADVIGLNCSVGPARMLDTIEIMSKLTNKKLAAQPNAGMPRNVKGRNFYLCSPEYISRYAKHFIQIGVRIIGGCCGTTPEMIRSIASLVRAFSPSRWSGPGLSKPSMEVIESVEVQPIPLAEKSNFGHKLAKKEFVSSVELNPPKGWDLKRTLVRARTLHEAGVDAINIPDGPRASARMSPMAMAVRLEQEVGIETILHYCCRDRNLLGMQSDLLGAAGLGLKNILLITGDPPKLGDYPHATAVYDVDSIGLTNLVYRLNHGLDLGGNKIGGPTSYLIGVGANPGAPDLDFEIHRFKWKVDAGAEYCITQPVFDVNLLENFLDRLEKEKVHIPVVAGIWPLASLRNAEFLKYEVPGVVVPDKVMQRMDEAEKKGNAGEEGVLIAQEALNKMRSLIEGVQVSAPFGKVKIALKVISVLG